jgi:hypothetical protein
VTATLRYAPTPTVSVTVAWARPPLRSTRALQGEPSAHFPPQVVWNVARADTLLPDAPVQIVLCDAPAAAAPSYIWSVARRRGVLAEELAP